MNVFRPFRGSLHMSVYVLNYAETESHKHALGLRLFIEYRKLGESYGCLMLQGIDATV